MRRLAATVALVALSVAWAMTSASAHALLKGSQPEAGSTVAASPTQVTLTFTEPPDLRLSSVHLLGGSGSQMEKGPPQPLAGDRETLVVSVPSLAQGVYTVTWRTTSTVDGHTTAGSFAFGVGIAPSPSVAASRVATPSPSAAGVMGRWLLYLGLALLLGAASVSLLTGHVEWRRPAVVGPAVTAAVGLAVMVLDQRAVARVGLGTLLRSRTGGHIRAELLTMAVALLIVSLWTARRSLLTSALVGAAAIGVMVARADAGHAGGSSHPPVTVGIQALHFAAVGAWAGGLPYLFAILRRTEDGERGHAARRFSTLATAGVAIVVTTGVLRALDELGAWSRFTSTSFGKALLGKLCIVGVVLALAGMNRFRHVAATARTGETRALSRTVAFEAVAVAAVLGVTALLTGLAPASSEAKTRRTSAPRPLSVEGHDFATTTRVRLVITPGTAGPNHFAATVVDYDTGRPVDASGVKLRFQFLDRADIPASTLALNRTKPGVWAADGTNVALEGRWRATALVQTATGGLEVPVTFETRTSPQKITEQRTPGLPTIYTVGLNDSRQVQVYLDPGKPGRLNELHVTYLDAAGAELHILDFHASATGPGLAEGQELTARKLDDLGHYVADLNAQRGRYRFTLSATDPTNSTIRVVVSIEVP